MALMCHIETNRALQPAHHPPLNLPAPFLYRAPQPTRPQTAPLKTESVRPLAACAEPSHSVQPGWPTGRPTALRCH